MKKQISTVALMVVLLAGCSFPVNVKVSIFPTPTPSNTSTPTITPTVTPSPTPSPTPTPPPAVRVKNAEVSLFLGDYEAARLEFQTVIGTANDNELKAAAMLGMGRALYFENNYPLAVQAFQDMIAAFPQDKQVATAYFFLGRCYDAQQSPANAAQAYGEYLKLRAGVIDDYIQEIQGDSFMAAGDLPSAISAYQKAIDASGDQQNTIWVELKLGDAYLHSGDFKDSLAQYEAVFNKSSSDYVRAHTDYLLGQVYIAMGLPEQAYSRYQDAVENYPSYFDSYTGLVDLVNAGVSVDDIQRGIVDYYAGKYGLAIDAFNRVVAQNSKPDASVFYYRALSFESLSQAGNALDDLDTIIQNYPDDHYLAKAVDEKAYLLWTTFNKYPEAAQTLLDYVEKNPTSPDSPDLLFEAGRIQERNNLLSESAATWEKLITTYPSSQNSYQALFLAGISQYRASEYAKALVIFQRCLVLTADPEEQAAAYVWIGKTLKEQGQTDGMNDAWTKGAQLDPTGYYSVRASELLNNIQPFSLDKPVDYGYDLAQERGEAETWLKTTFKLPPETELNGLGDLTTNKDFQRGAAFWDLGLYPQARDEFEIVRVAVQNDPSNTFRLMNYLVDLGIYRSAVLASRHILDLAGLDDVGTLKAPAYFNHIRFGIFYKDLIFSVGKTENLSPLLLLSVIRQESLFEGFATSGAGARGLMQIMPATGKDIASNMNWPDGYSDDDLYRPVISIPMGGRYLARQQDYFNGNIYAALAAYNGGPGNTMIWNDLAKDDPDLLLEVIRSEETRTYIKQIYTYFNLYRLIYTHGS